MASRYVVEEVKENYNAGEQFADLFEASLKNEKLEGSVVKGIVLAVQNDVVIVDIGIKTEGIVPLKEFGSSDVNAGDEVEVYLERIENASGNAMVSREKALREESWDALEKLHEEEKTVDGVIFGRVKGGFTVDVDGVVAFLPGSQVDIRPVKDITPLMGVAQPFQILKMDRKQGNMVVSRRAILEESRAEAREELLAQIKEGQVLEGVVKNITDYGAFVDLGSVDGLLHVTDISWSRVNHPSEVLSLGQAVKVQVIKYNIETKRVSLGMKQLEENPWDGIDVRYPVGKRFKGRVTNITDYGAFVELEPGIEGLVHVSEISWTKNNIHPRKLLSTSEEVECVVLSIDAAKHRISLGMKQCDENPWVNFAEKYPAGSVVEGEVKNVVDFGLFVGFDGGIDGLVHLSDVTWSDESPESVLQAFEKDQKLEVKVLSVDVEKERISLGIKQLADDPVEKGLATLGKGNVITCTVKEVRDNGIEVETEQGVSCFIKKIDLARDRVEQRPDRFAVGDRLDAKVMTLDKSNRKVTLSVKALEIEEQKKAIEEYGSTDSGASLGDILGAALSQQKTASEQSENDK